MSRHTKPYANSYWVQGDVLLAGEYPGAKSRRAAEVKIIALLNAGIDCFIDLTEQGELIAYEGLLRRVAHGRGNQVEYHRHPIRDVDIPTRPGDMVAILDRIDAAISNGRKVYVHCWGGTGRTGTVVGCHLVRRGLSGEAALERVHTLWSTMAKAPGKPHGSPETRAQRAYVRRWREPKRTDRSRRGNGPVAAALRGLRTGPSRAWENLTMIPLIDVDRQASPYTTMAEASAYGSFQITEVSAAGSVPTLKAVNRGPVPVLLLDGEELLGAKQHRIVNLSILVPAKTTLDIPVSCVEQGRWSHVSHAFRDSDRALFAEARAQKTRDVNRSFRMGGRQTDQAELWKRVRTRLDTLGVASPTSAMSDGYAARAEPLQQYVRAFDSAPGQVGAVFAIDGRRAGVELFDSAQLFRHYFPKVLRSYALDALARGRSRSTSHFDAESALEEVARVPAQRYPAVGLGEDHRFESGSLTGGTLVHEGQVVHLAAFWTGPSFN